MTKRLISIENKHKGDDFLIICTGKNVKKWWDHACYIHGISIGINNCYIDNPDYHLFTNNQRYKKYHNVFSESQLMLGENIKEDLIKKYAYNPIIINYTDNPNEPIDYRNGRIYGYFRTAGNLAIMIAHVMGAKNIYIAGMDGYTLNSDNPHYYKCPKDELLPAKVRYEKYDVPVYNCLRNIYNYGINFKIITPTVFKDFYDPNVLECV